MIGTSEKAYVYSPARRDGESITIVASHLIKAIYESKKELTTAKRGPFNKITFEGERCVELSPLVAMLRLCDGMITITAGQKNLRNVRQPWGDDIIKDGYYLTQKGNNWTAFFCSFPVDEFSAENTLFWTDDRTDVTRRVIDPWIALAVSKDKARTDLGTYGGNIAADGFRIHYRAGLAPWDEFKPSLRESLMGILEKCEKYTNIIRLNEWEAKDLKKVAQRCSKLGAEFMMLEFEADKNQINYSSPDMDAVGTLKYKEQPAKNLTIAIQPKFIYDAIGKPNDTTYICLDEKGTSAIMIQCGDRYAVLQPMDLGRGGEKE